MDASLKFLGNDVTFEERLQAKQDEVAATAVSAGRSFTQSMGELVQLQQTEILRLQTIIHDNTVVPERYPVDVAIGSVLGRHDMLEHVLLAVASDRSVWLLENFKARAAPGLCKWVRVPGLPQVADEVGDAG